MEQVLVRPAAPADAPVLAAIDQLASHNPWSAAQWDAACRGGAQPAERTLVVEENGSPIGFLVYARVLDEAAIHTIAVHPTRQGRGLATTLLRATFELLAREGVQRCCLEVRASNRAARALYVRLDFQTDGVRRNYYPGSTGREDAILMSKQL